MIEEMLTVKKLKELIDKLPDDMLVVVDGYERGINQCVRALVTNLFTYENTSSLYGEFINEDDSFFKLMVDINTIKPKGQGFYLSGYKP